MPSPTFNEIWFAKEFGHCEFHPQAQYKRSRRYFRIRSLVRIAFWMPLAIWGYSMILGAM